MVEIRCAKIDSCTPYFVFYKRLNEYDFFAIYPTGKLVEVVCSFL